MKKSDVVKAAGEPIIAYEVRGDHIDITTMNFQKRTIPLPQPTPHDKLTTIIGIGMTTEEKLNAAGITTFKQLAETETAVIREITNAHPSQIKRWQADAAAYQTGE